MNWVDASAANIFKQAIKPDFAFLVCFTALAVLSLLLFARSVYYRYLVRVKRLQYAFLVLTFLWTTIRAALYFIGWQYDSFPSCVRILEWAPLPIEFSGYYSLILCKYIYVYKYTHLHHTQQEKWRAFKRYHFIIYFTLNFFVHIANIALIILDQTHKLSDKLKQHDVFVAIIFALLFVICVVCGTKAVHFIRNAESHVPHHLVENSIKKIKLITVLTAILFLTQCIWGLLVNFNVDDNELKEDLLWSQILYTSVLEVIPTSIVLMLFGTVKVSPNNLSRKAKRRGLRTVTSQDGMASEEVVYSPLLRTKSVNFY